MKTSEASIFGFANSIIGLPAFAILVFIGVAMLGGSKFGRWIWLSVLGGATLGIILTHYLFFQSVYRINALCPYCMLVWLVTMLIFWYVLIHTINAGHLPRVHIKISEFLDRRHLSIFLLWAVVITGLILKHFWYYFGKFI
jgi:uncharacterized membrane protein